MAQRVRDRGKPAGIVRRELAGFDRADRARQPRRAGDHVGGVQPLRAPLHHFERIHAEDRDVLRADMVADFDIGAVERADRQRAVQRELHVAGAGGFHTRGGNLLGQIRGRNDHLGEADIVIRDEHHFEPADGVRVAVDDFGDVIDQLDDQLGIAIARCRLAGEDFDARHPVALRLVLDGVIERDRLQHVQQLPLIFVDALDLHVEQRAGIDLDAEPFADQLGERHLVAVFDLPELLLERGVAGIVLHPHQIARIIEHAFAAGGARELGQPGIGEHQPAAEGDAVGLVGDASGVEMMQIVEHGLLHQLGMHRRHAIDAVRADERQMAHAHAPSALFVDQRHRGAEVDIARAARFGVVQMHLVDPVDDLKVPRQVALEQLDRPGFERFRQQRVVGVGQGRLGDLPGVVPHHAVMVDQQPHQLGDGQARMGVVELHRRLLGEAAQLAFRVEMALHQILQRRRHEEIFLAQPQFAARRAFVIGIEEFADRFGARFMGAGAEIVAGVEHVDAQRVRRARRPQPQRVDVLAAPADDRRVIGHRLHGLAGIPDRAFPAACIDRVLDAAAEMHLIDHLRALQFPRIAKAEPFVGIFLLPALADDLAEQAEIVTDAIAERRDFQRRHAFHETGRQPAETAIAERGVRLAIAQIGQPDAEIAERRLEQRHQAHIVERVGEQPADQEFERQIIDALATGVVALLLGHQPAVHDAVAQRQRGSLVPIVLGGLAGILADGERQLGDDRAFDFR